MSEKGAIFVKNSKSICVRHINGGCKMSKILRAVFNVVFDNIYSLI